MTLYEQGYEWSLDFHPSAVHPLSDTNRDGKITYDGLDLWEAHGGSIADGLPLVYSDDGID
jgi:hypothetical protein